MGGDTSLFRPGHIARNLHRLLQRAASDMQFFRLGILPYSQDNIYNVCLNARMDTVGNSGTLLGNPIDLVPTFSPSIHSYTQTFPYRVFMYLGEVP